MRLSVSADGRFWRAGGKSGAKFGKVVPSGMARLDSLMRGVSRCCENALPGRKRVPSVGKVAKIVPNRANFARFAGGC